MAVIWFLILYKLVQTLFLSSLGLIILNLLKRILSHYSFLLYGTYENLCNLFIKTSNSHNFLP